MPIASSCRWLGRPTTTASTSGWLTASSMLVVAVRDVPASAERLAALDRAGVDHGDPVAAAPAVQGHRVEVADQARCRAWRHGAHWSRRPSSDPNRMSRHLSTGASAHRLPSRPVNGRWPPAAGATLGRRSQRCSPRVTTAQRASVLRLRCGGSARAGQASDECTRAYALFRRDGRDEPAMQCAVWLRITYKANFANDARRQWMAGSRRPPAR